MWFDSPECWRAFTNGMIATRSCSPVPGAARQLCQMYGLRDDGGDTQVLERRQGVTAEVAAHETTAEPRVELPEMLRLATRIPQGVLTLSPTEAERMPPRLVAC